MTNCTSSVADALKKFFESSSEPILFAGAGVSMLAGLPDWKNFLLQLAELVRPMDPMTANQMVHYVSKGSLTKAADFFWITDEVLEGNKHTALKTLLSTYNSKSLEPLASLPFKGVLTTNFDRSIIEAIAVARKQVPRDYRLGDSTFKQAVWETELHVTRIHGCVEAPSEIILSENQFHRLLENEVYIDLLTQTFINKCILFLGFSFYDPAIKYVLEQIERRFGVAAPGRHMAILPKTNASELIQKANRLNIAVVKYEPDNNHEALWAGIVKYTTSLTKKSARAISPTRDPYAHTKQYLAACYARASVTSGNASLREVVIEGILSALLQDAQPKSLGIAGIHEKTRLALGVKDKEIIKLIDSGLKTLVAAKLVRKHNEEGERGSRFAWVGIPDATSSLDEALHTLKTSILDRAYVQEGWKTPKHVADMVDAFLKAIIHKRGWDLGAAFASGKAPDIVSIRPQLSECGYRLSAFDMERIERTIESVFQRPTEQEARILGELGRISFIVELAFQAPRTTLLHKATLPRKIYFDTNVLLPAFVEGHPHYQTFRNTLRRLKEASTKASNKLQMLVCDGYLNEMISHRNAALTYAKEAADDFEAVARSDAIYHGPGNINVFVGAYVNAIENGKPSGFDIFLNRVAPYHTESELRRWIEGQGFAVVASPKNSTYGKLYGILEQCNATRLYLGKEPVLVEHDALQMALIEADHKKLEKALFITADRQLYEDILASPFGHLAEYMVSHVGIVQLVDLIIGFTGDERVLGELLWNSNISEGSKRIRSYLTVEALNKYDAALAMKMHEVVEAQSEEICKQLEREGASLDTFEPKARVKAFRSFGSLESSFFKGMSEAIEKLSKS